MTTAAHHGAAAIVVGGGISGMSAAAACAGQSGLPQVLLVDRGRRLGGRLAARTLRSGPWAGHVVDMGAAYFTVSHPAFAAVVEDWQRRGLVRPWTDTFAVADPHGLTGVTVGPMRFASPGGLRSLVQDLAAQLPAMVQVRHPMVATAVTPRGRRWRVSLDRPDGDRPADSTVDPEAVTAGAVALCMPPQQSLAALSGTAHRHDDDAAADQRLEILCRLRAELAGWPYEPILALVAQWPQRKWQDFAGCFVNGDEVLSFIADDGDRRGDGAAVLVAHSTPQFAAAHLRDPAAATIEMVRALCRIMKLAAPTATEVKRWSLARPAATEPQLRDAATGRRHQQSGATEGAFLLDADGSIGVATDAFDPRPRVEAAWLSGHHLGMALSSAARTA